PMIRPVSYQLLFSSTSITSLLFPPDPWRTRADFAASAGQPGHGIRRLDRTNPTEPGSLHSRYVAPTMSQPAPYLPGRARSRLSHVRRPLPHCVRDTTYPSTERASADSAGRPGYG